jgi:ABC-type sugar transport system permease subunit
LPTTRAGFTACPQPDRRAHTLSKNTVIWVTVGASSEFLLGLMTALALNRPGLRGLGLLRGGLLLPLLIPTVVAGRRPHNKGLGEGGAGLKS